MTEAEWLACADPTEMVGFLGHRASDRQIRLFAVAWEQIAATVRRYRNHPADYLRDIFGNPFRPVAFFRAWRTDTTVALARQMYKERDFSAMPILADALQDVGCDNEDILDHCYRWKPHVRGCWVVDKVLDKK